MKRGYSSAAWAVVLIGTLLGPAGLARAQQSEQIKPYVLVIMDISGSMVTNDVPGGPTTCGGNDTRLDHAKCALQQVIDAHADIQFGLARFRATADPADDCTVCEADTAIDCSNCNEGNGNGCTPAMSSEDRFQLLVPFVDDSADLIRPWVDFSCGACSYDPADNPELRAPFGESWTPIGGSLRGAERFFEGGDTNIVADGLDTIFGADIDDPIGNDPYADLFVEPGEQCRPYVVILLTDGAETCEVFDDAGTDDTVGAAASLLSTAYGGNTYRIETRPIGFGVPTNPCNAQIEALAQAGGAVDEAGCEGFYADDEQELVDAFNQIVIESIKVEVCDGEDNDCDGEVDEGYQLYCDAENDIFTNSLCDDPGDDCDGMDDNCVDGIADEQVNACGFCGDLPTEVCNMADDDCDGLTDEDGMGGSLCGDCTFTGSEICDGIDNDCDDDVDEDLVRDCGTDVGECELGTEECQDGEWVNCDATQPQPEECDGLDNDCDGTVDGFTQECTEDPDNGPPYDGICQPGSQVCPVPAMPGMGNSFEECLGEIGPADAESCDLLDNDCDNAVDEDTGGADCSTNCGMGETVCNDQGMIECVGSGTVEDEVCNNNDDDCDGIVDEDVPDDGPCTDGGLCIPGVRQCIGGEYECIGGEAPGTEICDCLDNDCDDDIDEEPPALCAPGSICIDCQCAYPCEEGEFQCPPGRTCSDDGYCLIDPCYQISCPDDDQGNPTACLEGECVPICETISCPGGTACRPEDGVCVLDNCIGFPDRCGDDQLCVAGECVADPCAGVDCPAENEFCQGGACVASCAGISCPDGQECQGGSCEDIPCQGQCGTGQVCDDDTQECVDDPCTSQSCEEGQVCDSQTGGCVIDPCLGVDCPGDEVCVDGNCYERSQVDPDAGIGPDHDYVSPGGGGGCGVGGRDSAPGGLLFLGLALALIARRRGGLR